MAEALRQRLAADPWDVQAWEALVATVARSGNPAAQRTLYEELLARFPTAVQHWRGYAELEMASRNSAAVKSVFSRCLLTCLDVELWRTYLSFIKKVNEGKGDEGVKEVRKAYEYTLDRVGNDIGAGVMWQEYIAFLSAPRPGQPAYAVLFGGGLPGQEDAQRITLLRRAYHRALVVPSHASDALWRAYEQFEYSGGNKQLARRSIDDMRPRWQAARSAYPDRKRLRDALQPLALALPPGQGGSQQAAQMEAWHAYLSWERLNPQRLEAPLLMARVSLAYDQALMPLYHFSEVWYDYARWRGVAVGGGHDATAAVLRRARKAVPDSMMLAFAAADVEEARGEVAAARAIYEELLVAAGAGEEGGAGASQEGAPPAEAASAPAAPDVKPDSSQQASASAAQVPPQRSSLVWVQYMRFLRRTDSVAASRKGFLRARRSPSCTWHVFAASALMEWHSDRNDKVPRNIFELGLKHWLSEPGYVIAYVDFLVGLGDVGNARALFERALAVVPPDRAAPLWDRFLRFEYETCASLAAVASVESRRREALGEAGNSFAESASLLLAKYRQQDLWPCPPGHRPHLERLLGLAPPLPALPSPTALPPPPAAAESTTRSPLRAPGGAPPPAPRGQPVKPEAPLAAPLGAAAPPPAPGGPPPPAGSGPQPLKQIPLELGNFMNALPPARAMEGPVPDVDRVIEVLLRADLSGAEPGPRYGVKRAQAAPPAGALQEQPYQHTKRSKAAGANYNEERSNGAAKQPAAAEEATAGEAAGVPPAHDVYRQRLLSRNKAEAANGQ